MCLEWKDMELNPYWFGGIKIGDEQIATIKVGSTLVDPKIVVWIFIDRQLIPNIKEHTLNKKNWVTLLELLSKIDTSRK